MMSKPRYELSPVRISSTLLMFNLYDTDAHRPIGTAWYPSDAEKIVNRLNAPADPHVRTLMAMALADFRLQMEHDNGGPLIGDPQVALLLADLCDFLHFTEGERAIVLGRDLILLLGRMDLPASEPTEDELILIQA